MINERMTEVFRQYLLYLYEAQSYFKMFENREGGTEQENQTTCHNSEIQTEYYVVQVNNEQKESLN